MNSTAGDTEFGPLHAAWRGAAALAALGAAGLHFWARRSGDQDRARDLAERLALPEALHGLPRGAVWLHGASVGEIRALAPLVRALAALAPDLPRLLTASTPSGRARALEEAQGAALLAPLDAAGPLDRFLDAVQPRLHVIAETEIWPTRLWRLRRARIPAALVSARLSPEKVPRYRRLVRLYGPCLRSLALVAPASEEDRERLVLLGADPARLGPVGNLKWDAAPAPPAEAATDELGRALNLDRSRVWIVLGSVHPEEAAPLIATTEAALGVGQTVGWIVAPRHPERFGAAFAALEARPGGAWRASRGPAPADARLIVLDRIGVLPQVYPLARAAALGGSFVPVGGHSPLEAAAAGRPLVAGPHVEHQRDLVGVLAAAGGLVRCRDAAEAGRVLARWTADETEARRVGAAARAEVEQRRGVSARLARALLELL